MLCDESDTSDAHALGWKSPDCYFQVTSDQPALHIVVTKDVYSLLGVDVTVLQEHGVDFLVYCAKLLWFSVLLASMYQLSGSCWIGIGRSLNSYTPSDP